MKLSKETVAILKNFASINNNLMIDGQSSILKTVNGAKSIFARAQVTEEFNTNFGIYDLNEFLSALSIFSAPDIEFKDTYALISENKNKIKYFGADPSVLIFPSKEIVINKSDVEFKLTADQLSLCLKTADVLRAPDISFVGNGGQLSVVISDKKNPTGNTFDMPLEVETNSNFKANLKVDNLKIIPGDYEMHLALKKVLKMVHSNGALSYVIAIESDSTFE